MTLDILSASFKFGIPMFLFYFSTSQYQSFRKSFLEYVFQTICTNKMKISCMTCWKTILCMVCIYIFVAYLLFVHNMAQHVYIIFSKFKSIFFVLVFVQAAYRVACFLVHQHLYLVEKEYFDLILVLIQSCFGVWEGFGGYPTLWLKSCGNNYT